MNILSRNGAEYRTKLMTQEAAARFARCLKANVAFDGVAVLESNRAKGEKRHYVVYHSANAERRELLLQQHQDARAQRAAEQGEQYLWILNECRRFFWLQSPSGEVYEVAANGASCSCPDHEYRCRPAGIQCKHLIALTEGRGTFLSF